MNDLNSTISLFQLLKKVPSKAESWVDYDPDSDEGLGLKFKVAGMPKKWKIFNALVIGVPKLLIWAITVDAGIRFLMETAGMVDLILNSVAMGFILDIDELIADRLANEATK